MRESGPEPRSADRDPVISARNGHLPAFTTLFLRAVHPANVYSKERPHRSGSPCCRSFFCGRAETVTVFPGLLPEVSNLTALFAFGFFLTFNLT